MNRFETTIEQIPPNQDVIRMTEKILDQNKQILEMNAKLLAAFSNPPMISGKTAKRE